jgi:hypothetical protein
MPLTAAITGLFRPRNSCSPAKGGRLQVPAGAEKLVARGLDDCHAQIRIVAKLFESFTHQTAGLQIDGVGLGPVQGDFEYGAFASCGYDFRHLVLL